LQIFVWTYKKVPTSYKNIFASANKPFRVANKDSLDWIGTCQSHQLLKKSLENNEKYGKKDEVANILNKLQIY